MSDFVTDTFTDTATTALTAHTGEVGATWTKHPNFTAPASPQIDSANRVHSVDALTSVLLASGVPATANYDVTADIKVYTLPNTDKVAGVAGRNHATLTTGYYWQLIFNDVNVGASLYSIVAGAITQIGSTYNFTVSAGDVVAIKLSMSGTTIAGFINGVSRVSGTDSGVSAIGLAAINLAAVTGDGTSIAMDNFAATPIAVVPVPSKPTGFALSSVTTTSCTLSYTDPLDASITSYRVEWDIDSGFPSPNSGTFVPGATTFAFSPSLAYSTPYFFRLIATNASGDSTPSDTFSQPAVPPPTGRNCGLSLGIGIHL